MSQLSHGILKPGRAKNTGLSVTGANEGYIGFGLIGLGLMITGGPIVGTEHTGVESHELQSLRRLMLRRFQRLESALQRFLEPHLNLGCTSISASKKLRLHVTLNAHGQL